MDTAFLQSLNKQLLELDRVNGSQALGEDFLMALLQTIEKYTGAKDSKSLWRELVGLYELFLECHPRMANILFDLQHCLLALQESTDGGEELLCTSVRDLLSKREKRLVDATRHAVTLFKEERCLLLHSYSTSLIHLLDRAAKVAVKPRIIVAAQEKEKSDKIIRALQQDEFDFIVVSEYSLSHVIDDIDTAIFGALTLNQNGMFVLGPGSASIISQLKIHEIPCYVYLPTNKFSLWEEPSITAFQEIRTKSLEGIEYEKHVYSHDEVSCSHVTGVITEKGLFSPDEVMDVFRNLQSKFASHEAKIKA